MKEQIIKRIQSIKIEDIAKYDFKQWSKEIDDVTDDDYEFVRMDWIEFVNELETVKEYIINLIKEIPQDQHTEESSKARNL